MDVFSFIAGTLIKDEITWSEDPRGKPATYRETVDLGPLEMRNPENEEKTGAIKRVEMIWFDKVDGGREIYNASESPEAIRDCCPIFTNW